MDTCGENKAGQAREAAEGTPPADMRTDNGLTD